MVNLKSYYLNVHRSHVLLIKKHFKPNLRSSRGWAVLKSYLDFFGGAEAVELVEQLQHGSLDLSLSGLLGVEPLGADGVQLVDEDDGRRLLLGQGERVSNEFGAVADEHLELNVASVWFRARDSFYIKTKCVGLSVIKS